MKSEGRSGLVLPCTETGAHDTFGGIGVDVLLFREEQKTSEASPDEEEFSVKVDWNESSDSSSSVNESLWDVDGLGTLVKPGVRGSDTEPFSCEKVKFKYSYAVDTTRVHLNVTLIY